MSLAVGGTKTKEENLVIQFKMKATNCVRFGHSLWSAISCQREWFKGRDLSAVLGDIINFVVEKMGNLIAADGDAREMRDDERKQRRVTEENLK